MRLPAVVVAIALLAPVRAATAQARIWSEDERITITTFNEIAALSFDGRRVFAASLYGLQVYDAIARRWQTPSTVEDGYPVFERPTAIAYDRSEGGVWLLTAAGNLYLWSELSGRWDMRAPGSAPAELFQQTGAAGNDIAWRVLRGVVTLDPHGRRWPMTAVIPAERPGTYWVATAGGNLLLADSRNLSAEWLAFGTLTRGISALGADAAGNLWLGGDGRGPRDGITQVDTALQRWTSYESYSARAPRRMVNRILTGNTIWAAAADGLYALTASARSWQRLDETRGLSSVRALAHSSAGVWAGTQHGLTLIDPQSLRATWSGMDGVRINGLAERNDTIWIASDAGLWRAVSDSTGIRVVAAPAFAELPWLRGRVAAVARTGTSIAVLVQDGLYLYDENWSDVIRTSALAGIRPHDLRGDEHSLIVLGTRGLAEWRPRDDTWHALGVPADLPEGPVHDALRTGDFLWVATPAGAVRLRWR